MLGHFVGSGLVQEWQMKIEGESGSCVHNILCVLDLRCTSVGGPVVGALVGALVGAATQAFVCLQHVMHA